MMARLPVFQSFLMAGFECTYARNEHQERMDLLATTKHDVYCREDYQLLKELGMTTVREGLAWHQIDRGTGRYNFSRFEELMKIGQEEGIEQIWDLNHFDYPEDVDPFSPEFVARFGAYAKAAIQVIRKYFPNRLLYICPINEMSFFTYIAADLGVWAPYEKGRGVEFKRQLVRASIAAMDAIRSVDENVRFIQIDPIFYRTPHKPITPAKREIARQFIAGKFQAWDMLGGLVEPELGGHARYLDILGCNYYYYNQEWIMDILPTGEVDYQTIPLYSKHRISVGTMLKQVYQRYKRPLLITETGGWGELRPKWWRLLLRQAEKAKASLPLMGVCSYPIIDREDWNDRHLTNSGFWDFELGDETLRRIPHEPTLSIIRNYMRRQASPLLTKELHRL